MMPKVRSVVPAIAGGAQTPDLPEGWRWQGTTPIGQQYDGIGKYPDTETPRAHPVDKTAFGATNNDRAY